MSSFDVNNAKVFFILGGPGAGKGTQCGKLVEKYGFTHLSAGDLLRAERDSGSETAEMINEHIRNGTIVPKEITIGLLKTAMEKAANEVGYLIDGFPRAVDQWTAFEEMVVAAQYCVYYVCTEEEMQERLLGRGQTSGRVDDNLEAIKKRFKTFRETSMPVIDGLREQDRCKEINSNRPVEDVFADSCAIFGPEAEAAASS